MTREQAIQALHCPDLYGGIYGKEYGQAISIAVESLRDNKSAIVHCKDCKYFDNEWDGSEERFFEDYWCEWAETKEDDFCSLGVRKETNNGRMY